MNPKELIDKRLWKEIRRNYINEQYSNAVLDGVQYIGDLIREMSGEDGDGYNLIGRVFNTNNPKIKVNRLRTQTEQDIQNGVMLLLQGFYRAIRNERVHEKKVDTEQEAFELILFLNHVLRIIGESKGKFTVENTLRRVFDDNFLPKEEYVQHIIQEIPPAKKFEVAIEVFRNRNKGKNKSDLAVFWNSLTNDLKGEELKDIRIEISECLRYAQKRDEVTSIIFLIGKDWENLDQDARLRAENLLIRKLPSYLSDDPRDGPRGYDFQNVGDALHQLYREDLMELKKEFSSKVFSMFEKSSPETTEFVVNNFGGFLNEMDQHAPFKNLEDIIKKRFKSGDRQLITFVDKFYSQEKASELKGLLPPESHFDDIDDDLPF